MKKGYTIFLLAVLPWLAGCESVNVLTEIGTSVAVATGNLSPAEADSINRGTKAVTKSFESFTPEQEYYIGRTVAATLLTRYPTLGNAELEAYVNRIGQTLARFSSCPETFGGYHFGLLNSDEINAFAAPGGLILVTRGLVGCCRNEDELAAVLAHEIGHVEKKHGLRAIRGSRFNSAGMTLVLEGAKTFGGSDLAQVTDVFGGSIEDITATMVNSGYSRNLEFEADAAAVEILRAAGYAPVALMTMLTNMKSGLNPARHDFAATHPSPDERIGRLVKLGVSGTVGGNAARARRFAAAVR